MLSFQKLLVLISIIGAVIYGFRLVTRLQKQRERQGEFYKRQEARRQAAKAEKPEKKKAAFWKRKGVVEAEEMVECKVCGDYVPASKPKNCGRGGCPY
jgi:hypothetical protein